MSEFGRLLVKYRRGSQDPQRGGQLTQERLAELLELNANLPGYSNVRVSNWERDKERISADDRRLLVGLLQVLHECGGIRTLEEANGLLFSGNYRDLDADEIRQLDASWLPGGPQADPVQEVEAQAATWAQPDSQTERDRTLPRQPVAGGPMSRSELLERRNQLILLDKVKNFWVKGVLDESVNASAPLQLSLQRCDQAIDHPWQGVVGPAPAEAGPQVTGQGTVGIFLDSDRALLILGEPGSGKTTVLIGLARDLVAIAERDPAEPVPVILNLVSWAESRGDIADWVVQELVAKYQIPRQMGQQWLEVDQLLLLLDGLDEVPYRFRGDCVAAINRFREAHGLAGIVVCSRTEAYESAGARLKLGGAVALQPLSVDRVDNYLAAGGGRMAPLRAAVREDAVLQGMAQSPLMLNVMSVAYGNGSKESVRQLAESTAGHALAGRQHLFATYVQQMFRHRAPDPAYDAGQTQSGLAWLAKQMFQHHQSVFMLGGMQPSWLASRGRRWIYVLSTRTFAGLMVGVFMFLFRLQPLFIGVNAAFGLLLGIVHGIQFDRQGEAGSPGLPGAGRQWRRAILSAVVFSLLSAAVMILLSGPLTATPTAIGQGLLLDGLYWGMLNGTAFAFATFLVFGQSWRSDIHTVEALSWAWSGALKGAIPGLLFGVVLGVLAGAASGFTLQQRASIVLEVGLVFGLIGGLSHRRVETKSRPGQGIRLSIRNGILAALLFGVLDGLLLTFTAGISIGLRRAIQFGLGAGLEYGGLSVVNHLVLRVLLWREGWLPWNIVRFLDHAAGLIFLHKVGGGYLYVHRLLQEYFADFLAPER